MLESAYRHQSIDSLRTGSEITACIEVFSKLLQEENILGILLQLNLFL
jgi:hypothetical protein